MTVMARRRSPCQTSSFRSRPVPTSLGRISVRVLMRRSLWLARSVSLIYDRVGVRYINQFTGEAADRVRELIRPEMHGALSVPLSDEAELALTLTEALFRTTNQHQLRVRWGGLPENTTVDPALPAVASRSWILDLDSFTDASSDFYPSVLGELTRHLAEQGYRFFRGAVTPAFDEMFGGGT
jgi:uncharacterized protein (TIGR04255 family)